ncbi:hypothetical protein ABZ746_07965 [Streptomyces sp. NPDC020096]
MEWINPKYAQVVEDLRQRQAAAPATQCARCQGRGTVLLPATHGGTRVKCPPCEGKGSQPDGFRMFVTP